MIRGTLTTNADILAAFTACADGDLEKFLHGRIAFVEAAGHKTGVAVQTQRELREIVGTDREAVDIVEELVGKDGIGRNFAHHIQAQTVFTALETMLGKDFRDGLNFADRANEGNHQFNIGKPHFITHTLHGEAFHFEAIREAVSDVTRSTAEAQHRVFFIRFVARAANELLVFVALKVGHTNDHFARPESTRDGGHAFGKLADEELARAFVALRKTIHRVAQFARDVRIVEHQLRMQTDVVVDDEFKTSQTDAFVWNLAELERQLRVADVHHHFDRNLGQKRRA